VQGFPEFEDLGGRNLGYDRAAVAHDSAGQVHGNILSEAVSGLPGGSDCGYTMLGILARPIPFSIIIGSASAGDR